MFDEKKSLLELLRAKFNWRIVEWTFMMFCFVLGLGAISWGLVGLTQTSDTEILSCPDLRVDDAKTGDMEAGNDTLDENKKKSLEMSGCVPWGKIYVDVSGAVLEPGLYELSSGARLALAIELAGGFSQEADNYFIHHQLNLARKLADGDKIYIPSVDERVVDDSDVQEEAEVDEFLESGKRSINSSTQEELKNIPGIGEKRAQDIIQNRPYASLNELVSREVITEALFKKIKEEIQL